MILFDFKIGKKFKNHLHRWLFDIAISQFYQNIAEINISNFGVFYSKIEEFVTTQEMTDSVFKLKKKLQYLDLFSNFEPIMV